MDCRNVWYLYLPAVDSRGMSEIHSTKNRVIPNTAIILFSAAYIVDRSGIPTRVDTGGSIYGRKLELLQRSIKMLRYVFINLSFEWTGG